MSVSAAVSVPGKTILFGEHAAVYGHPALVAALDLRMTVTVTAREKGTVPASQGTVPGLEGTVPTLVDRALTESLPAAWLRSHDVRVEIKSDIPVGAGFGSSAALAVGIAAACRRVVGAPVSDLEIAEIALRVERHQHGNPSGVDVEAVLRGGALWCRRTESGLSIEPVPAPHFSAFRLFDSGTPAESTGDMVAAVRRLRDARPAFVHDVLSALDAAAVAGRAAIERGDHDALVPIVRRAQAALEQLEIVHPEVRREIRAIEAGGGAAKISGAGGSRGKGSGLVLVVHPDPAWHAEFRPPAGWIAHDVALGAAGLREEVAA